jgi:hypothetical protein
MHVLPAALSIACEPGRARFRLRLGRQRSDLERAGHRLPRHAEVARRLTDAARAVLRAFAPAVR